ncbi:MAG TPA: ATP-binding cassette domain-containing protein [Candidatus Lachnoclostridium avicola]|nr:ATP-binding cassette domain-containing protein [Candidatus Lachnoclostridium avicola]
MLYQIADGTLSVGGNPILRHFDFEIRGAEKLALVGRNGAGKTTLLRLIAGELDLDRDDRRRGNGITCDRKLTVGVLSQQAVRDPERTVEEEILSACPATDRFSRERFEYEQTYDRFLTALGFSKDCKKKKLSQFSGGQQTRIALIRLLLEKPDILLLDEPTNHLDLAAVEWLEEQVRTYENAVVMVSHDRFFLDRTAQAVYELEDGRLTRYPGNYTAYRAEKEKRLRLQKKAYEQQRQEEERLLGLVERFKHKPRKAAFARAKKKQLERMKKVEKPAEDGPRMVSGPIEPLIRGGKWVLEADRLRLGYDKPLLELSFRLRRGQKVGLLGPNGAGKTTFLRTIAGLQKPLGGTFSLGSNITMGYFDQNTARLETDQTVLEHFTALFPAMTEKDARKTLGMYLFSGADAGKKISSLSGGEKARLVLAELLASRPNFLILDEPTNHMDIPAKEALEAAFRAYTGTILVVSHDRYLIRQVADSILLFENGTAMYYPFSYEHYLERKRGLKEGETVAAQVSARDQALISSLRSVPKGERHRLREIPTEEAYRDWKLRLAGEEMEKIRDGLEETTELLEEMDRRWEESREFWDGEERPDERARQELEAKAGRQWEMWHEACLEWMEVYEEGPHCGGPDSSQSVKDCF